MTICRAAHEDQGCAREESEGHRGTGGDSSRTGKQCTRAGRPQAPEHEHAERGATLSPGLDLSGGGWAR